ncbi:MAG: polysaccharide export protein [Muribaculaceae bacterium]|jgi:polysaccharide export outer membrane protein|nr:polysaccharide export protein [Muribaculaceae bacterium]
MNFKSLVLSGVIAIAMASCSTSKTTLPYFSDMSQTAAGELPAMDYLIRLQPEDELQITVNSEVPEATSAYNLPLFNPVERADIKLSSQPTSQTYIVDSKGNIDYPVLGSIHVQGMTIEQLKDYLTAEIAKEVKDPIVTVNLMNFKVAIGGEVKTPNTYKVNGNRITILDALAMAGDLTEYGERANVLIIREENGQRSYAHIDLNKSDLLRSPYYYLKQNDYIYVSPNKIKQANSKYNTNNSYKLSVTSTIVSACSVIASLIIALAVK